MSIIKHSTVKGTAYVSVVCAVVAASGIGVAMASSAEQSSINSNVVLGSDSTLKSLPTDSEQDSKGLPECIQKESERAEREWRLAVDYVEATQSGEVPWQLDAILCYLDKYKKSSMNARGEYAKAKYCDIAKRFELVLGHPKVNLEKVEDQISTLRISEVKENANKVDAFKALRDEYQYAIDAINSADVLFTKYGLEEKINPQYNILLRRAVAEPYNNVVERLKQEIGKEQERLVECARKTSDEVLVDLEEAQKVIT